MKAVSASDRRTAAASSFESHLLSLISGAASTSAPRELSRSSFARDSPSHSKSFNDHQLGARISLAMACLRTISQRASSEYNEQTVGVAEQFPRLSVLWNGGRRFSGQLVVNSEIRSQRLAIIQFR
jgi:hypothetical protein